MILVLLYRFSESDDSILGYLLCQKLVQEGYRLLVTTTAKREEVKKEEEVARQMSQKWKGSITILKPEGEELEEPDPEWIAKLHKTYFAYLPQLREIDVHTIIGTLPETTKTAVDLKKVLKCKLILLATTKVRTHEVKQEVNKLAMDADEIWSVGPDLFSHFKDIFRNSDIMSQKKHRQVMFKPEGNVTYRPHSSSKHNKIASMWNSGHQLYIKGKKQQSDGSNHKSFEVVGEALDEINNAKINTPLVWHFYSMKEEENSKNLLKLPESDKIKCIAPLSNPKSIEDAVNKISSSLAFIVPDVDESTFNFMALTAMWKGIPTLVSDKSSIGKWLTTHCVPNCSEAVVNLTGNPEEDKKRWICKLHGEILDDTVDTKQWADKLSKSLSDKELWKIDLSALESETNELEPETQESMYPMIQRLVEEVAMCPLHQKNQLTSYCKRCNMMTCSRCDKQSHKNHIRIPIEEQGELMKEKLHAYLRKAQSLSEVISKKQETLTDTMKQIESRTQAQIKNFNEQFERIVERLCDIHMKQLEIIEDTKTEQISKIGDELSRLNYTETSRKKFEEVAQTLLQKAISPSFIKRSQRLNDPLFFLSESDEFDFLQEFSFLPRYIVYEQLLTKFDKNIISYIGDDPLSVMKRQERDHKSKYRMKEQSKSVARFKILRNNQFRSSKSESNTGTRVQQPNIPIPEMSDLDEMSLQNQVEYQNLLSSSYDSIKQKTTSATCGSTLDVEEIKAREQTQDSTPENKRKETEVATEGSTLDTHGDETGEPVYRISLDADEEDYKDKDPLEKSRTETGEEITEELSQGSKPDTEEEYAKDSNEDGTKNIEEDKNEEPTERRKPETEAKETEESIGWISPGAEQINGNYPTDGRTVRTAESKIGELAERSTPDTKREETKELEQLNPPVKKGQKVKETTKQDTEGENIIRNINKTDKQTTGNTTDENIPHTGAIETIETIKGSNSDTEEEEENKEPTEGSLHGTGAEEEYKAQIETRIANREGHKSEEENDGSTLDTEGRENGHSIVLTETKIAKERNVGWLSNVVDEKEKVKNVDKGENELRERTLGKNSIHDNSSRDEIPSLLKLSPGEWDAIEGRFQIVRFVRGLPCTIRGPNSEVLLHVPEGVHGVVLANIHTNHAKFLDHIPPNECVVSPICEYQLKPFIGSQLPRDAIYILQVPHIIRDVPKVRNKIRIQHIDIDEATAVNGRDLSQEPVRYEIDEKYITIYTTHFCDTIVTAECVDHCSGDANVFLFGDLNRHPETEESKATVKVYFGSRHSEISDYKSKLTEMEGSGTMALKHLTNSQIVLSRQPYKPSKSTVSVTLEPGDSDRWQASRHFPLKVEKHLNEALLYTHGHICRHEPTEVGVFHVESSEAQKIFRGTVHIMINIAPGDPNIHWIINPAIRYFFQKAQERQNFIRVELCDYSLVPRKVNARVPSVVKTDLLGKLALKISMQDMKTIAICFFKLKNEDIKNAVAAARENTWQFNYDILCKWYNQSADKSRENLANHLREANAEGLVDSSLVNFVLGVHRT